MKAKVFIVSGVLLLSAATAFWALSKKTLDSHECFVSVTAREMFEGGSWVLPTCNGQLRINKTPLSYWLVATSAKITGRVDEFTARLPSAVFAFLSAVAILYFVNQWLGFRTTIVSTAVWATSLAHIRQSHMARPDMVLMFFIMLCFFAFYSAFNAKTRREQILYMLIFWISFGLANLAKGPAPVPLVLIPLFSYIIVFRQWRILPKLLPIVGLIILLLVVLPWPLAIAYKVNWDLSIWKREFYDRLFGDYAPGHFPVYYYLLIMFKFITPWVAFLPMALAAPFYRIWDNKLPTMQFLWVWFVADLLFLTIDPCKRQHYILPLMPAMAILIGILLEDMAFTQKAYTKKFAKIVLQSHFIVITVGMIGASVYVARVNPQLVASFAILSIITIVVVMVVSILFAAGRPALACAAGFTGILVWFMFCYASFAGLLDKDRPSRDFAEKIAQIIPQSEKFVAYERVSSRFVQYFGRVVPEIQDKSAMYEQGDWIIVISPYLDKLNDAAQLRRVYYRQRSSDKGKEDSGGALFHKSAPVVEASFDSKSKDRLTSTTRG